MMVLGLICLFMFYDLTSFLKDFINIHEYANYMILYLTTERKARV